MSLSGRKQRLTLSGLLSALVWLSAAEDTSAASLYQAASFLTSSHVLLAQANEASSDEAPVSSEEATEDDVPFFELNEALTTARSKLAELTKAAEIAKVAGELRDELEAIKSENRQLKSVLSQLQTQNSELLTGKQSAEQLIEELEAGAETASVEVTRLDDQLESMRWQNSQLTNSLAEAEQTAREKTEELEKVRSDFDARTESLTAAVDESSAEITRLQRELDESKQLILASEQQQDSNLAELTALRLEAQEAVEDQARLGSDLDGTITELADTRNELKAVQGALEESTVALRSSEQEASVLREQLSGNRSDADQLRARLETAEAELQKSRALNASLEQQVGVLKTAAGEATKAARQNLLAVEDQINEINAAIAFAKADELLAGSENSSTGSEENGAASSESQPAVVQPASSSDWVPRPSPPRAVNGQGLIAAAVAETGPAQATVSGAIPSSVSRPPAAEAIDRAVSSTNLASLITDLPEDRREDAEVHLAKLKAERGERGLSMTVPGTLLFAVNSEQIEPEAFDSLASVAGLVDLYEGRDVLIVGHTDAVGDADYNQELSERRAALVKKFFVDNFEIDADRMEIEGKGEQDPITSNATANGRDANRRVEVVILD